MTTMPRRYTIVIADRGKVWCAVSPSSPQAAMTVILLVVGVPMLIGRRGVEGQANVADSFTNQASLDSRTRLSRR